MWARPPHKKALDQMWYAGALATCHRENFVKFYDLGERVLGPIDTGASDLYREHALHARALAHLPFTTHGEVARFWDLARPAEARAWTDAHTIPVEIEGADGSIHASRAAPDIETRLATEPPLSNRLRIINPFDPAIRDRARAERLFGFSYRNEMFVPADKRVFGYYVYPLLEGDRFVGRLEAKADKSTNTLCVSGIWTEPGVRFGQGRVDRLDAELARFARLGGLDGVTWACPRPETRAT